ncbi:rna-directed dna polymerase from mobile element jockey-like [Pitangus sulphuratus]|nr:rna-directed dna polymerase from mobile element jockey-like [Pitangus sulphuratus]
MFISGIGSGIESVHSKLADERKLSGAVDTLEGRDAIQRDLDRLEKWVPENLLKFNKAECKVLHLGLHKPQYQWYHIEQIEGSPAGG